MSTSRKRKSRWGKSSGDEQKGDTNAAQSEAMRRALTAAKALRGEDFSTKKQKTDEVPAAPAHYQDLGAVKQPVESAEASGDPELAKIKAQVREFDLKISQVDDRPREEDESPSPDPVYNDRGVRTNSRKARRVQKLIRERTKLLEKLMSEPALGASSDGYSASSMFKDRKPTRRVTFPADNQKMLIGLLLGPRGNSHKRMEQETQTKISIRGKGAYGRKHDLNDQWANEPLHAHIIGESEEGVKRAAEMIEAIVNPRNDNANDERMNKQLVELAAITGTMRQEVKCRVCGEQGHKMFECPNRDNTWERAQVVCEICGQSTHPTRDCPQRKLGMAEGSFEREVNNRLAEFMAEVNGDPRPEQQFSEGKSSSSAEVNGDHMDGNGASYGGDDGSVTCYNCQGTGHTSRECPNPKKEREPRGGSMPPVAEDILESDPSVENSYVDPITGIRRLRDTHVGQFNPPAAFAPNIGIPPFAPPVVSMASAPPSSSSSSAAATTGPATFAGPGKAFINPERMGMVSHPVAPPPAQVIHTQPPPLQPPPLQPPPVMASVLPPVQELRTEQPPPKSSALALSSDAMALLETIGKKSKKGRKARGGKGKKKNYNAVPPP